MRWPPGGPFEANAAVGDPVDNVTVLPPLSQPISGSPGSEPPPSAQSEAVWRPPSGAGVELDEKDGSDDDGSAPERDEPRFGTGLRLELPRILHRADRRHDSTDRFDGSADDHAEADPLDGPSGRDGAEKPQLALATAGATTTADDLDDLLDGDELRDDEELPEAISASR